MDPETAVGMGYSESKWVAEHLLAHAAKKRNLPATIVRVGQLGGDTRIGGWGTKEWLPALVGSAPVVGCLPTRDEVSTV